MARVRRPTTPQPPEIAHAVSPSVLTPAVVLQTYGDGEWEQFALEWAAAFDPPYAHLDRVGGAGDKGRDIVAYTGDPNTACDLDVYQCKHYDHPIQPNEIWRELGKLCVYTFRGDYRVPRRYRIIAPHGVGGTLADLLTKPEELRAGLIAKWDDKCRAEISQSEEFLLEGALLNHVQGFDFRIVGYIPVHELLSQHRRTSHWFRRFRRDPPPRPASSPAPAEIQPTELRYVKQLLDAYGDNLKTQVPDVAALAPHTDHAEHFQRSRTDFFMADSLNRFYRDQFPPGAFEDVKKQVFDGVVEVASAAHPCGMTRVRETVKAAVQLPLAQTDYTPYVEPGDKKGVCHHLANDDKLVWVKP
jgi:hypothetical protein